MVSVRHIVFSLGAFGFLAVTAAAAIDSDGFVVAQGRQPPPRPAAGKTAQQPAPAAAPAGQPAETPQAAPAPHAPVPRRTEILRFDNWTLTCNEFTEGPKKRVCSAQLQVSQQKTNNVLLAWTVGLDKENRPVSVIQVPTGVSIAPGIEVHLGKAAVRKMPFVSCEPARCTASIPVDNTLVRDISAAATADVIVYAPNGAGVKFNFPLKGFDKAYAELAK
jgi:invasion protein IalB